MTTVTGDDELLPSQDGVLEDTHSSKVMMKLLDEQGDLISYFPLDEKRSMVDNAEDVGLEIPSSCRAGACFVCAGRVVEGMENIDIGKLSVPLVDIDEDQILMCIAGAKEECFHDGEQHEIVVQKYM